MFFKEINENPNLHSSDIDNIYYNLTTKFEYIVDIQDPHITCILYINFILNHADTNPNFNNFYKYMDSYITKNFKVYNRSYGIFTCKDKNCVSFINSLVKIYSDNINNDLLDNVFNDDIKQIYTDQKAIIEDNNTNPFGPDPNLTIICNYHEFIKTKIKEFEPKLNTNADNKDINNQSKKNKLSSLDPRNWFRKKNGDHNK